jgi:hypothetical protein
MSLSRRKFTKEFNWLPFGGWRPRRRLPRLPGPVRISSTLLLPLPGNARSTPSRNSRRQRCKTFGLKLAELERKIGQQTLAIHLSPTRRTTEKPEALWTNAGLLHSDAKLDAVPFTHSHSGRELASRCPNQGCADSTVQQSEAGEALHALDGVKFFLTRERLREVIVKV